MGGPITLGEKMPEPGPRKAPRPPEPSVTVFDESYRVRLTGDVLTATAFGADQMAIIPFGAWLNAIALDAPEKGAQFAAELQGCSSGGCVVGTDNGSKVIIARRGIAEAAKLDDYDMGFQVAGLSAISDEGLIAIPVVSRMGKREIWTLRRSRDEIRFHRRVEHDIQTPCMLIWRENDLFMLVKPETGLAARRVLLDANRLESATPIEPWMYSCAEGRKPVAIGIRGDTPEQVSGWTFLPIYREGNPLPGVLELTQAARPKAAGGYCTPLRVKVDCYGRFCVVSSNSDEIWCLRFAADGAMEKASRIPLSFAGDAKGIIIDSQGRFYYLDVEMQDDMKTPKMLHLIKLD